ncbi:MAG: ABC transporter ATP-binding protein/permease [Alphaproteobacteria bacterium]|nr:ABC transporter ATP-binding protein/permease [Alphaproteobacteria bacterium]
MITALYDWFEKRIEPFPSEEPTRPPKTLMVFLWHYSKPVLPVLLVMSTITAAVAIMEVLMFGFLGSLVDRLNASSPETFWADNGVSLSLMALMIVVVLPLTVFLGGLLIHQSLLGNFPMIIRWQAHRYLLGQSMSFYQDDFAGRIATKVMQTSLAVREAVMKVLDVLVFVTVYFIGAVVLVAVADWRLAVPLLVWLVCYVFLLRHFIPRLRRIAERQADARSLMTGQIVDSYTNILTVKLFSHRSREEDYAREGLDGFLQTVHEQMRQVTGLQALLYVINCLLIFSTSATAIGLWLASDVSTGAIAVAIGLALRLNGMSQWIMWELSALFENIGTVEDGITTLSNDRDITDASAAPTLPRVDGAVSFDQVGFHYGKLDDQQDAADNDDHGEPAKGVLHDITLDIAPGEKIGLVGRSGAGKSTLVNLLLRLYDVESGRITIDGHNIADVTQNSLRGQISMVTQDTSLLHRSVRENILYGRPDASEADMIQAATQAEAMEFIADLMDPKGRTGFDAHVGERGVKLSGGQRQRIAIARVLLKDAPILILDEATSALDSEVEAAIQEQLFNLMKGKTVIAIAHRLSTIATMDRLVVMDGGHIAETGTHEALIANDGLYASLWQRQSGGFLGGVDQTEAAE